MKCTCANKPNMEKKTDGNHNYWWECPQCHRIVGKKEEDEERNMASEHQ